MQCWLLVSGFRDWVLSARRVSFRRGGGRGGHSPPLGEFNFKIVRIKIIDKTAVFG